MYPRRAILISYLFVHKLEFPSGTRLYTVDIPWIRSYIYVSRTRALIERDIFHINPLRLLRRALQSSSQLYETRVHASCVYRVHFFITIDFSITIIFSIQSAHSCADKMLSWKKYLSFLYIILNLFRIILVLYVIFLFFTRWKPRVFQFLV